MPLEPTDYQFVPIEREEEDFTLEFEPEDMSLQDYLVIYGLSPVQADILTSDEHKQRAFTALRTESKLSVSEAYATLEELAPEKVRGLSCGLSVAQVTHPDFEPKLINTIELHFSKSAPNSPPVRKLYDQLKSLSEEQREGIASGLDINQVTVYSYECILDAAKELMQADKTLSLADAYAQAQEETLEIDLTTTDSFVSGASAYVLWACEQQTLPSK
jgi:hypothetical protein